MFSNCARDSVKVNESHFKYEYLRSRASRYLSLSSSSSSSNGYSTLNTIEILVLISWILHPGILHYQIGLDRQQQSRMNDAENRLD